MARMGSINANKKRELVIAKKRVPRGDAKKRAIAATVAIPVKMPERSFLPPPDGGRLYMYRRSDSLVGRFCNMFVEEDGMRNELALHW